MSKKTCIKYFFLLSLFLFLIKFSTIMTPYLYFFENRCLQKSLRNKTDFEVFVNDNSNVGEMYLNSILAYELDCLENQLEREIIIYSNYYSPSLYTKRIKQKLNSFIEKKGSLIFLSTSENTFNVDKYANLNSSILEIDCTAVPSSIKTTCFITNESIALEVPDNLEKNDRSHHAVFYINAINDDEIGKKHKHYKTEITKLHDQLILETH